MFSVPYDDVMGKSIFLTLTPEYLDFTNSQNDRKTYSAKLTFKGSDTEITLSLSKKYNTRSLAILNILLAQENIVLYCWNIKALYTYALGSARVSLKIACPIIDLKVAETFFAKHEKCPNNLEECEKRIKYLINNHNWSKFKQVYHNIYKPLISKVLPSVEIEGILDINARKILHAYYEIEGTKNGRLRCQNVFARSFLPHTLSANSSIGLNPNCGFDNHVFMYYDISHMEVSVLQWITGCPVLGEILSNDNDVYAQIWQKVTGKTSGRDREIGKGIFLPIIYGMGNAAIAEKIGISVDTASLVRKKLEKIFPIIFSWMDKIINSGSLTAEDQFGRLKIIDVPYKAINFMIASPASIICLDKFLKISNALAKPSRIVYNTHDAYCIACEFNDLKVNHDLITNIFIQDDPMYKGLILKSVCKIGNYLNELIDYSEDNVRHLHNISRNRRRLSKT